MPVDHVSKEATDVPPYFVQIHDLFVFVCVIGEFKPQFTNTPIDLCALFDTLSLIYLYSKVCLA